jgi:hypothetical protein
MSEDKDLGLKTWVDQRGKVPSFHTLNGVLGLRVWIPRLLLQVRLQIAVVAAKYSLGHVHHSNDWNSKIPYGCFTLSCYDM